MQIVKRQIDDWPNPSFASKWIQAAVLPPFFSTYQKSKFYFVLQSQAIFPYFWTGLGLPNYLVPNGGGRAQELDLIDRACGILAILHQLPTIVVFHFIKTYILENVTTTAEKK
jgi:hypothetical protein